MSRPSIVTRPPAIFAPAALVGEQAGGRGGLARGRLADEAEDLALADDERDLVVDVDARRVEDDGQALDGEDDLALGRAGPGGTAPITVRHHPPPCRARCRPSARPMPSAMRLVADGQDADQQHRHEHRPGLDGDADAVLVDHEAPVGGRRLQPKPRNESAAMRPIE